MAKELKCLKTTRRHAIFRAVGIKIRVNFDKITMLAMKTSEGLTFSQMRKSLRYLKQAGATVDAENKLRLWKSEILSNNLSAKMVSLAFKNVTSPDSINGITYKDTPVSLLTIYANLPLTC